jgi:hypothetical protein
MEEMPHKRVDLRLVSGGAIARIWDSTDSSVELLLSAPTFAELLHKLDTEVLEPATRFETDA